MRNALSLPNTRPVQYTSGGTHSQFSKTKIDLHVLYDCILTDEKYKRTGFVLNSLVCTYGLLYKDDGASMAKLNTVLNSIVHKYFKYCIFSFTSHM